MKQQPLVLRKNWNIVGFDRQLAQRFIGWAKARGKTTAEALEPQIKKMLDSENRNPNHIDHSK